MNKENLEEFVFEEHILQINDQAPSIERLQRYIRSKWSFPIKRILKEKLEHLKISQEYSYKRYDYVKSFFENMNREDKCKASYDSRNHKLIIEGLGIEIFQIEGKPLFITSKYFNTRERKAEFREGLEITQIPVSIGVDEAILELYKQPQISFSPFDKLEVFYNFKTEISLGSAKIYYELSNKLWNGLHSSIFGNNCPDCKARYNLNLFGEIFLKNSGQFLYQGNFECYNTSFPFFIRREKDKGDRKRKLKPIDNVSLKPT